MRSLIVLALALAVAIPASATTGPQIRILKTKPFVVSGTKFKANERVVVTLRARTVLVRRVFASSAGSFSVDFGSGVLVSRCSAFALTARGASGDFAAAKVPLPACMPDRSGGANP